MVCLAGLVQQLCDPVDPVIHSAQSDDFRARLRDFNCPVGLRFGRETATRLHECPCADGHLRRETSTPRNAEVGVTTPERLEALAEQASGHRSLSERGSARAQFERPGGAMATIRPAR
jgi:hypothetical protein